MNLFTALHRSGGIVALGRQLELDSPQSNMMVETLLPQLVSAFREFLKKEGADSLLALLAVHGGVTLAMEVMDDQSVADSERGEGLLLRIGLIVPDEDRRALALLAMLTGGYLSAIVKDSGNAGAALAELLEAEERQER